MENFRINFQEEVRQHICPLHHMSPSIKIVEGKIALKCCCRDFKLKCYKIIIEALTSFKKDYPEEKFELKPKLKVAYIKDVNELA